MVLNTDNMAARLSDLLTGKCLVGIKNSNIIMCSLKGETVADMQIKAWEILNEFSSLFSNYQIDYIEDRYVFESMFK